MWGGGLKTEKKIYVGATICTRQQICCFLLYVQFLEANLFFSSFHHKYGLLTSRFLENNLRFRATLDQSFQSYLKPSKAINDHF